MEFFFDEVYNIFILFFKYRAGNVDECAALLQMRNNIVYNYSNTQSAGGQTYSIPMKRLAKGVYYVTVRLNDKKEVTKKIIHE